MLSCPFECGYQTTDGYSISFHVEISHSELEKSPFLAVDDASFSLALALQEEEEDGICQQNLSREKASHSLALSLTNKKYLENDPRDGNGSEPIYLECPQPECGEYLQLQELNDHLDIHASLDELSITSTVAKMIDSASCFEDESQLSLASRKHIGHPRLEDVATQNPGDLEQNSSLLRTNSPSPRESGSKDKEVQSSSLAYDQSARLGVSSISRLESTLLIMKAELGPFAFENRMPRWLYKQLERGPSVEQVNKIGRDGRLIRETFVENEVSGLIPVLAQLSRLSKTVERAYLCHPSTQHCFKRKHHGGFCGYLNIQMQVSYILGAQAQGHKSFGTCIPGILDIQDMIEHAWDEGINVLGRFQTGGVKGTRKWIGTPEASALYESLGIQHDTRTFYHLGEQRAHHRLFDFVEDYFNRKKTETGRIVETNQSPIYLQQPGHSLTIVGLERHKDGSRNLLVFDPGFGPSKAMQSLIGKRDLSGRIRSHDIDKLVHAYRRTSARLQKHDSFETLLLPCTPPPPPT